MKDTTKTTCERSDDLVAFLYHELDERDAGSFQLHLQECPRCESEVASFGEIRQSIVSWRDASLGAAWSPGAVNDRQLHAATIAAVPKRPSALSAIHEFFNLSPMWMKGAAAFASLLFCLCAVLAIAFLKDRNSAVVQTPSDKIYSQRELDSKVAGAVQRKADELKIQIEQASEKKTEAVAALPQRTANNRGPRLQQASYAGNAQGLRKPLTRLERRELAADLGLLVSRDDDDLDLTDRLSQAP